MLDPRQLIQQLGLIAGEAPDAKPSKPLAESGSWSTIIETAKKRATAVHSRSTYPSQAPPAGVSQ